MLTRHAEPARRYPFGSPDRLSVMSPREPMSELSDSVQESWHRFLDVFEPLRPELYRYCRYLTRSPWDAEDLVQDTMARAFVTLGCLFQEPPNPRAWMFRVASNLWIDRTRHTRELPVPAQEPSEPPQPTVDRGAAGALIARLSPHERAAVVLKDVFDLTLGEIADALSTTVGTVKSALHRGRGKLVDPEPSPQAGPARPVVDAFCEAFNARDLDRLTALLLDTSTVEIVGVVTEYGPEAARDPERGSLVGFLGPITTDERGGVDASYLDGYLGQPARIEVREHRDEPILLYWYGHRDGEAVRAVARLETDGDRLSRIRNYFFTPDVVAEVCRELDVPFRINGYRFW
jgi:RNA polymerase sigma-70 factor (ECF subfamily)